MGHRTNYILIENKEHDIYYAHWDANIIGRKLFYGPDSLVQYIRPLSVSEKLLDTVWGEGAALVDMDQQKLLFWGDEFLWHTPALVTCFVQMLRETTWKGWQVEWASEGQVTIAKYLGVDTQTVLNTEEEEDDDEGEEVEAKEATTYTVAELANLLDQMLQNHLQNLDYDPTATIRSFIKDHHKKGKEVTVNPHALEYNNIEDRHREQVIQQLSTWIADLREGKVSLPPNKA
ncbi:hypothetical protein [Microscilla marina]|uniref:Uncharacterized protein n=1 Tax=Microscilla marina ATCC 23134 TaxID=313606 RepID=A1ZNN2_MICM2|nr:hypothetical protein [Microscilla marina]EAY27921.1 hypothetical protein M23134_02578 [Microscilla marina ATCC 23134]